jgi:hypothetical protein
MAAGVIRFAGYEWKVKESKDPVGPGPNLFGSRGVRMDTAGRLHLAIVKERTGWFCSEVALNRSLGYGKYRFFVKFGKLDRNAVLGLFLWDYSAPRLHFREMDIEV